MTRAAIAAAFLLVLAAPFGSEAQPSEKIIRVRLLSLFSRSAVTPWHQTFRLGLGDLGWVEGKNMLKEILPGLSRVAVLWNPDARFSAGPRLVPGASPLSWSAIQHPARELGVQLHSLEARSLKDFDRVFEDAAKARVGAVVITPDVLYATNIKGLADLAATYRLPTLYHLRELADAGGLVTYGADRSDLYRRAATFVDKILKGARPTDLPVEQPTKFELVINMKAAKALGLTMPRSLLLRADQVIE